MPTELKQIPLWVVVAALAGFVLAGGAIWARQRIRAQRERERALMQALIDATRTGAVTWTYAQGQADRHLVARSELPAVLTATLRHLDAHRHEFGDRPAIDVRHLIDMLRLEALTASLPPSLLTVVQRLRDALRDRPELVGELVDRLIENQRQRDASLGRHRWATAAAAIGGLTLGLAVWLAKT